MIPYGKHRIFADDVRAVVDVLEHGFELHILNFLNVAFQTFE